jgi:predicted nucleic acid-binding protein
MRRPILVDTDVMVDYLRGHPAAVAFVTRRADRILLSSIVVAELYSGVKGDHEHAVLDDLVSVFRVVSVTGEIAKDAGLLKRGYGKSRGVGLADAILAATVLSEGAEFKTLNVKHYPMFKGLKRAYVKR